MKILSFESTCDETAVAVVEDGRKILTDQIFSQAKLHAVYGGVVPEIASRCHVESISILAQRAIEAAGIERKDIDAVAVSYAPGLIGAVLVGVNFAKSCAYALNVPLIPVHHIRGHIAANYLAYPELEPPFLCLAISGGNTILVDVRDYTDMKILGATRDDAAGEYDHLIISQFLCRTYRSRHKAVAYSLGKGRRKRTSIYFLALLLRIMYQIYDRSLETRKAHIIRIAVDMCYRKAVLFIVPAL